MFLLNIVIILALVATMGALGFGLWSMARGGTYDARHSEMFMWERVGFQGIAVVLMILAVALLNL